MAARPRTTYDRGSEEFSRLLNFSDAVFAIAMTIIVVGIGVPAGRSFSARKVIDDETSAIISFFISFAVLSYYWLAHHQFMSGLRRIESGLLMLNLAYLAFIAFIPFPTALVSDFDDATGVTVYALALGAASLMETLMFWRAARTDCFHRPLPDRVVRAGLVASGVPVVVFALSIPIAWWVGPTWAMVSWAALTAPAEMFVGRRIQPADMDEYFRPADGSD